MSTMSFATPDSLLGWLKKLAANHRLMAPRREGPTTLFRAYKADDLTDVDSLLKRATASPKEAILPKSEVLVRFNAAKDPEDPSKLDLTLQAPTDAEPTVLFGLRPCDARGFVVLDRPFLQGKYQDPYYKARREATVIITQACPTSYTGCFCNWVGSNPADAEGSDILFTQVDGGFALEGISDKGKELLAAAGFDSGDSKADAVKAIHEAAAATLGAPSVLENIPAKVASRFTDTAFWDKETAKCVACGACTYLCPTCQCFNITDEGTSLDGRRIRSWDSCMKSQFTLEASGHNPRNPKGLRWRQRVGHKFSYYPSTYEGNYSCVGCGRCVVSCPVSLDIREMVRLAVEGAPEGGKTAQAAAIVTSAETTKAKSKGASKAAPKS